MEVRSATENVMQDSLTYRGRSQTYKQVIHVRENLALNLGLTQGMFIQF